MTSCGHTIVDWCVAARYHSLSASIRAVRALEVR
jgi:hypothetical protein